MTSKNTPNSPSPDTTGTSDIGFFDQMRQFWKSLHTSQAHRSLSLFSAMMMTIILTTTYMQVTLNRWNAPFYQAIQDRDLDSFIGQLIIFAYIAAALTILNVTQTFVSKRLSISIRRGLVSDLLEKWLIDNGGRELHLLGSPLAEHADQRIHSDVRSLAETTTGLAVGLVQSVILLASFVTILWTLSPEFQFNVLNYDFILPGYLVWAALFYAGLTSGLNRLVGRHLVELNSLREAREAEFRTSLVQADMAESGGGKVGHGSGGIVRPRAE